MYFFAVLPLLSFFIYLNTGHELQKLFKNCWLPLDSSDLDEFGGSDEFGETDGCGEYEDSGNFGHLVSIWWLWWGLVNIVDWVWSGRKLNWVIFCESGESCEFGESGDIGDAGDTGDVGDTGDAGRFLLIWWGCCYIKMIDSGKFGKSG